MTAYSILKAIHMDFAMLSIVGFMLRGFWMLRGSSLLQNKLVKVLPHVVDTVFLLSGIGVVLSLDVSLFGQAWLLTKVVLLFAYIGLGTLALKGKTMPVRLFGLIAAVLTFVYIIGIAINKTPLSWFA